MTMVQDSCVVLIGVGMVAMMWNGLAPGARNSKLWSPNLVTCVARKWSRAREQSSLFKDGLFHAGEREQCGGPVLKGWSWSRECSGLMDGLASEEWRRNAIRKILYDADMLFGAAS